MKVEYGLAMIRQENTVRLFCPPLTWGGRLARIKYAVVQIMLLACMFLSFSFSFVMVMKMVNG